MKIILFCFLAVLIVAGFLVSEDNDPIEEGTIDLYFCPQDNCEQQFIAFLDSAQESIHCALFEVELESLKEKLLEKAKTMEVKIVTDDDYYKQFPKSFVKADKSGLMHNKFCIIDGEKVSTGSMNPTFNDAYKNNNNLLLIQSQYLAENYEDEKEILSLIDRCITLSSDIDSIISQTLTDHVYWGEIDGKRIRIAATPIDISSTLREQIFENIKPVILTSATLSVKGDFSFLRERVGLNNGNELALDSPFNYRENVMIYTPNGISDPKDTEEFKRDVIDSIKFILNITHGRTLILFTSYEMLNKAYDALNRLNSSNRLNSLNFLRQGEMDSYKLIEEFKNGDNLVLLGTHTFWQGIDIPGDALQCVIIVRLPFQVPDDPVTEARLEKLKENGKNPFIHYQIPNAILMFKQGFGRLIRTQSDKGIVAILDPRVRTRFYGERFLSALPDCVRTDSIEDMKEFFDRIR